MEDTVRISVVIPTFNRGGTVSRAVESALSQECPEFEIIIVDDGSTDGTRRVCEAYNKTCRYIYQENAGVSAARNRGVHEARYPWVAFLDSDDYWLPGHLSALAGAVAATAGKAAVYFGDVVLPQEDGGGSLWERCGFGVRPPHRFLQDASQWALMPIQPMLLQASAIRRSSYLEVGGLPAALKTREDTYLFFRLGLLFPACAVPGRRTVMTAEGPFRLTRELDSSNDQYWRSTLWIFREMLSLAARSRPECRHFFTDRLSAAHFSRGRLSLRKKKPLLMMKSLLFSAARSPSMFFRCLKESTSLRLP